MIPYQSSANQPFGGVTLTIAKDGSSVAITGADTGDLLTTSAAHGLKTGDKVTLTVDSGLTGLTTATDYYVIYVSATTFQLASSLANAVAGTEIEITADGAGSYVYKGQTYRALNWEPKINTREIRRNDNNGDEADFQLRAEPTTQSGLTLQLATQHTPRPRAGMEFADPDDATIVYVITAASKAKPEGDFWVCSIDYKSVALPTG